MSATVIQNGIFRPQDSTLSFATNFTERLRILPDGSVGVGTISPTQRMDIEGGLRIRQVFPDNSLTRILVADADGVVHERDASTISSTTTTFWTDNGVHIYNNNTGNVGIGIQSPTRKLEVIGDTYVSGNLTVIDDANLDKGIRFTSTGSQVIQKPSSDLALQIPNGRLNMLIGSNMTMLLTDPELRIGSNTSHGARHMLQLTAYDPLHTLLSLRADPAQTRDIIQVTDGGVAGSAPFGRYITLDQSGQFGLGTDNPATKFHVEDGGMLFSGAVGTTPVTAQSVKFFWSPDKHAIRAGQDSVGVWAATSIGDNSTAFGFNPLASGRSSFAGGESTQATADYAVALGFGGTATALRAVSLGYENNATNNSTVAMGFRSDATGLYAVAIGHNTTAANTGTFASGSTSLADGVYATAMGRSTISSGTASFAAGTSCSALENYSVALGQSNTAGAAGAVVMGRFNTASGATAVAFGESNFALGDYSFAHGRDVNAERRFAFAFGEDVTASEDRSIAVGVHLTATANRAMILGSGIASTMVMNNPIASSLMIGFESDRPTFFVGPAQGAGTTGFVGVATENPKFDLHVDGDVGINFKQVLGSSFITIATQGQTITPVDTSFIEITNQAFNPTGGPVDIDMDDGTDNGQLLTIVVNTTQTFGELRLEGRNIQNAPYRIGLPGTILMTRFIWLQSARKWIPERGQ